MSDPAPETSTVRPVQDVRLAQLPALVRQLAERVHGSGFAPEAIVYVETGARLPARELATVMALPMTPIWVRRGGHGLKRVLAPLVMRLPGAARDWLRRLEERSGVHRLTRRAATLPAGDTLRGKRVLLLDDAADTGRTLAAARALLLQCGVASGDVRTAVLAATTPVAQSAVDFYLFDCNCRMPWSADSDERTEAARRCAADPVSPDAPRAL